MRISAKLSATKKPFANDPTSALLSNMGIHLVGNPPGTQKTPDKIRNTNAHFQFWPDTPWLQFEEVICRVFKILRSQNVRSGTGRCSWIIWVRLFFGIEMSFFVVSRWPKSPFRYRDLFFAIEILHCVAQHLDCLLPGINLCVLFWASTSCKLEVREDLDTEKKIEKSRYLKKRHLDTN